MEGVHITYADGSQYIGDWVNGKGTGHGIIAFSSGSRYDGHFENGIITGNGVYTWPDGNRYQSRCSQISGDHILHYRIIHLRAVDRVSERS